MAFSSPEILFEDSDLIVINKPAGMLSQASPDPKRPHVVRWLEQHLKQSFFLQHRLDRDTTGVMLLTKTARVNKSITDQFRDHQVQKTYLALAKPNSTETWKQITIKNHLAPVRNAKKQLSRMVVVRSGGWSAETDFEVRDEFSSFGLIEARPKTGRTHQIRVHLAHARRPILGDLMYGGKSALATRVMLHASQLSFVHPISQQPMTVEAPLPDDFIKLIASVTDSSKPHP